MSDYRRRNAEAKLRSMYALADVPASTCYYCGESADTRDHVPPVSLADPTGPYPLLIYPACRECNTLLGDRYLVTAAERADFVAGALRTRYAKALKCGSFTDEELAEFGPEMRKRILFDARTAARIRARISFATLNHIH